MQIRSDEFLAHYGVKGMRWGVRREMRRIRNSESKSYSSVSEALQNTPQKLSSKQRESVKENEKRQSKKFDDVPDEPSKGWRPTKKQVAFVVAGAVIAGAIIYKLNTGKDLPSTKGFSVDEYKNVLPDTDKVGWYSDFAGKKVSPNEYKGLAQFSSGRIWSNGTNFITKESFDQKETTFKAGHEFFRVSHVVEDSFRETTYMVGSKEEAARYFLGWKDQTTNLISFKTKSDIRVPDLHTRLEAMREVLVAEGQTDVSPKKVMEIYGNFVGGSISGGASDRGRNFLANLSAKGYHAIVDDMDAGVYGEMPMVLFDSSSMTKKVTTLRENVDVKALTDILTEIPNRR